MAGTLAPDAFQQYLDANGDPLPGGLIHTYVTGTTTALATYTDSALSTAHANPIVLDSAGRPPSPIYLSAATYKFVLSAAGDTTPPTAAIKTTDPVTAVPSFNVDLDVVGTAGATIAANEWVYLSDGTGGRTQGRWYLADADLEYGSATARLIGIAVTGGDAADEITVRRMGRVTGLSGLTAGSLYYISATAGAITSTAPTNPRRVGMADSTTTLVIASEIEEPIKGFIPLDLLAGRILSSSATQNAAANGGLTASDSAPILQRVNGATDQALRLNWAATVQTEVTWSFPYPPDWDGENNVTVHLLGAMSGGTNTPTIAIAYFEGVGDSNAGGSTSAVTGTTVAEYTVTVTAANVGTHPNFASVSFTPGSHGTDAFYMYAGWVEYVRKIRST